MKEKGRRVHMRSTFEMRTLTSYFDNCWQNVNPSTVLTLHLNSTICLFVEGKSLNSVKRLRRLALSKVLKALVTAENVHMNLLYPVHRRAA